MRSCIENLVKLCDLLGLTRFEVCSITSTCRQQVIVTRTSQNIVDIRDHSSGCSRCHTRGLACTQVHKDGLSRVTVFEDIRA